MFDFLDEESPDERRATVAKHLARLGLVAEPEVIERRPEDAARLARMDARDGFAQAGGDVPVSPALRRLLGEAGDDEGYDAMVRE